MHHSKYLVFTFIIMLLFPVLFRLIITANYILATPLNVSSPASLKLQSKTALSFFVTCNVHSNVKMATGYVDSIFKAQCRILMTSLKLTTTSF